MAPSFAWLVPKLEFEFLPAAELIVALRQTYAEPKIATTEQRLETATAPPRRAAGASR